jgi:hypothetical protein
MTEETLFRPKKDNVRKCRKSQSDERRNVGTSDVIIVTYIVEMLT